MTTILDSRYSWVRLGITLLIATVGNIGMWAAIVVIPDMQAEFGLDRADSTYPYTLTMIGFALGNYYIGRAVDRFGITPSLIAAVVSVSMGFVASAMTGSFFILSAVHLIIGFGTAACFGPLISDVSQWFLSRRGIAVAIAASGNYLAGAIWPLVLSGVMEDHGWRGVYWSLAILVTGIVVPLTFLLLKKVPEDVTAHVAAEAQSRAQSTGFSPRRLMWLLGIAGIGCCVAMSMPQVHIVAYCADLGYGPAVGAEMLSLMLLGGVASRLISGMLADKLGGVATLMIGSTLQCIALFLYLPFDGLVPLYVVSTIFGLSQGGIVPSYAIIVREYLPPKEAGARVGFVMMATIVGMAFGGWMSGWIYDVTGSYTWAFLNCIGWNFLNIAIIAIIVLKGRSGKAGASPLAA